MCDGVICVTLLTSVGCVVHNSEVYITLLTCVCCDGVVCVTLLPRVCVVCCVAVWCVCLGCVSARQGEESSSVLPAQPLSTLLHARTHTFSAMAAGGGDGGWGGWRKQNKIKN